MVVSKVGEYCQISIIIVTYNSYGFISNCLKSIFQNEYHFHFEIIIIDNNSSDKTLNELKKMPYKFLLIKNDKNCGFAKACNQGINVAKGDYIFLLNPDTIMINNSINIFYEFMQMDGNEKVWCVGAQLYSEDNSPSKSYGRFPNLFDVILEQIGIKGFILKYFFKINGVHRTLINQVKEVPFIMGCNMFIRHQALEKIGLFNEKFFLNYEETELSWRAKKHGLISMILPEAKIFHYSRKSFTDLQSYLNHLWLGQLLFFKLTHHRFIFLGTKAIHLSGAILRFIFKFDKNYLIHAKNILSV
jgi:GT2 family glycosyltransferase